MFASTVRQMHVVQQFFLSFTSKKRATNEKSASIDRGGRWLASLKFSQKRKKDKQTKKNPIQSDQCEFFDFLEHRLMKITGSYFIISKEYCSKKVANPRAPRDHKEKLPFLKCAPSNQVRNCKQQGCPMLYCGMTLKVPGIRKKHDKH